MASINSWNCELCKSYNDILENHCRICSFHKPTWITSIYQASVELERGIYFSHGVLTSYWSYKEVNELTEQEQLFAKFYNSEKLLVKDMEDFQLREHRDELRRIAFEAKARAVAADDEDRDRRAKTKNKEWLLTPDTNEVRVTDAVNAPKLRQKRMSQLDKMRVQLAAAGLDDETVNEMVKKMERKATEKDVNSLKFPKPSVPVPTFGKPKQVETDESKSETKGNGEVKTNPFSKFAPKKDDDNSNE